MAAGRLVAVPLARGSDDEKAPSALWLLPAQGGEARKLLERPGGFASLATAKDAMTVVGSSATMPRAGDAGEDERLRTKRKDRKVNAVLHESSPVRFWDHDLGAADCGCWRSRWKAERTWLRSRPVT